MVSASSLTRVIRAARPPQDAGASRDVDGFDHSNAAALNRSSICVSVRSICAPSALSIALSRCHSVAYSNQIWVASSASSTAIFTVSSRPALNNARRAYAAETTEGTGATGTAGGAFNSSTNDCSVWPSRPKQWPHSGGPIHSLLRPSTAVNCSIVYVIVTASSVKRNAGQMSARGKPSRRRNCCRYSTVPHPPPTRQTTCLTRRSHRCCRMMSRPDRATLLR